MPTLIRLKTTQPITVQAQEEATAAAADEQEALEAMEAQWLCRLDCYQDDNYY